MKILYPLFISSYSLLIKIASIFSTKAKLFVKGRKNTFHELEEWCDINSKQTLWFHVASLGEFEQGRPLIEIIKKEHPQYAILLTFFSPSGYEVRKNYEHADFTCYLPLDSRRNAIKFIKTSNPKMAFFIKYEFWNNYLKTLNRLKIPTFSISSIFRKDQVYFKKEINFHNNILRNITHFFVQNENSKKLLKEININNVSIIGDTRFDRVANITKTAQPLDIIENFIDEKPTIILGSVWEDDLNIIAPILNKHIRKYNLIIAPHKIDNKTLDNIDNHFSKYKVLRYSKYQICCDGGYSILTIDNIGLLTSIYACGDIAYIGGAFKTGLHNILEPATFGVPVIFGPNYKKFDEAKNLISAHGAKSINSSEEFEKELLRLLNTEKRKESGQLAKQFIDSNTGATSKVLNYIESQNLL